MPTPEYATIDELDQEIYLTKLEREVYKVMLSWYHFLWDKRNAVCTLNLFAEVVEYRKAEREQAISYSEVME